MGKRGEGERGGRGKGIIINNNGRVMRGGGERRDMKIIKLINRERRSVELSGSSRFGMLEPGSSGWNHPKLMRDLMLPVKMTGSSRFNQLEPRRTHERSYALS